MRKGLNRLLVMWKPNRKWLFLSIMLTIGGAIGTLAIPALSQTLINEGIIGDNLSMVIHYGGYMLILTLAAAACQIVNTMIAVRFSERTADYLRTQAYDRIQTLSFGNLDRMRPSDLLVRLTNDIQNIKIAIQQGILNLPLVPIMLIITMLLVAVRSPALIWLMVVLLIVFSALLGIYLWLVLPVFGVRQERYDAMSGTLQENMSGVRVVKAFVRQKYENERFSLVASQVRAASLRAQTYIAVLIPTMLFTVNLALVAIFYTGGIAVLEGT
ncbi:MAG: ABC transporter permease, partial [Methanoregula sp.]|nr:ABC transporter permease [Methanoregula sp.]